MQNLPQGSINSSNPLRKLAAFATTVVLAGLALMFSVVAFAVILVAGTMALIYLWWKTRELRKQMRNYSPQDMEREGAVFGSETFRGEVIEGEAVRVDTTRDAHERR
jgi:hypothetical protein